MRSQRVAVQRRPKDRKDQILDAARTLIVAHGYRNVSMAQIADEVGITAGALYRHFVNKSVLLGAVIGASFDDVTPPVADGETLDEVIAASCAHIVARPDAGVLWWRESRNLPFEMRDDLGGRLREINQRYAYLIGLERPELATTSAEELAWAVQSVLATPGSQASRLPSHEYGELLARACRAVCAVEIGPPAVVSSPHGSGLVPLSKREAILGCATALFDKNGYAATSLSEIGAAAGVTAPNLYSYFENKADLLNVTIERGTSALWLMLHSSLRENDNPRDALIALVHGYTRLALEKTVLVGILGADEVTQTEVVRARQREYVAEWTGLLVKARPNLGDSTARVLVHTALGLINNMAGIDHLGRNAAFEADLTAMATAALLFV